MKILVISPNWIGDCIMAQPMLRFIKTQHPGACIVVLAPKWVSAVMRMMPEVADVIEHQLPHGGLQLSARWQLARQLKAQRFGMAYILPNSFKSALIPWFAGIGMRIGYLGESRYFALNQRFKNPLKTQRPPMVEHYARLAGWQPMSGEISPPRLTVSPSELLQVRQQFKLLSEYWVFCPGAEYGNAKRWPLEHYVALAQKLHAAMPNKPLVLLGSAKDNEVIEKMTALAPDLPWCNLAGKTTLGQACVLLSAAKYVVSNDSGLMHIAASLRVPQLAIFGSTDPKHTPPLSPIAKIIWLELPCSPCFKRECPLGHLNCLNQITPDQAFLAITES